MPFSIILKGFLVSMGLIVAIGAQNAFVLKQGIKGKFIFPIVLICSLIDATLIFLGVSGVGKIIASSKLFLYGVTLFGILFLSAYGFLALRNAFRNESLHVDGVVTEHSFKKAILTVLALTLLNPHVWIDTFLLIGSIGGHYTGNDQYAYILGATSASFLWFFALGYGARLLAPLFERPKTWQLLDGFIAFVMFSIAASLTLNMFQGFATQ